MNGSGCVGTRARRPCGGLEDRCELPPLPNRPCDSLVPDHASTVDDPKPVNRLADFLRRNNCDEVQGYCVSRPIPPDELAAFVQDWVARGGEAPVSTAPPVCDGASASSPVPSN